MIKNRCFRVGLAMSALALSGCSTYRESNTARTPEEEMLLSKATDYALDQTVFPWVNGKKVFVDVSTLECTDKGYVTDAVRQRMAVKGAHIAEKAEGAEVVVTVRAGMFATQSGVSLVGLPSVKVPSVVTSGALETPEIAFFKHTSLEGRVKLCLTAYANGATRELLGAADGEARTFYDRWSFFFVRNYARSNVPELKIPPSPEN